MATKLKKRPEKTPQLVPQKVAKYQNWTREQLLMRLVKAERKLAEFQINNSSPEPTELAKPAKPSAKHTTRFIALKFAYLGKNYNGFEHHNGNSTTLPTVEEVLFKALARSRLIPLNAVSPEQSEGNHFADEMLDVTLHLDECDYTKCGRTDKGVSAFGQVIGIRVRSNKPLPEEEVEQVNLPHSDEASGLEFDVDISRSKTPPKPFNDIEDEIDYCNKLNRILPYDIRILAWCPNPPPDFSARRSCRERQYRYFFTEPAFPLYEGPGARADGRPASGLLDIEAMQKAARLFEGLHDFRNFCRVDGSKQLTNFKRRITYSNIEEMSHDATIGSRQDEHVPRPKVYAFVLHGSAFLWHQVRHMVGILFLIGQRFEQPSLITELLDVEKNPRRPAYEMADEAPLVLWDCIFPDKEYTPGDTIEDSLQWIYADLGAEGLRTTSQRNRSLLGELWSLWRGHKMDEILSQKLLEAASKRSTESRQITSSPAFAGVQKEARRSEMVFEGGNLPASKGAYVPVMNRLLKEPVEDINAKYLRRKAQASSRTKAATEAGASEAVVEEPTQAADEESTPAVASG